MFRAIFLQVAATLVAVLIAALFAGTRGAVSAALGGAVCTLPNWLFALRLNAVGRRPGGSFAAAFLFGELFKIAATIGLVVLVVKQYPDVHWLSMLLGMALALKAVFLLAFWKN